MEWYCSLQFNNANVATKEAAPVFAAGSAIFWASQDLACYNRASEFLDILGIKSFLPSTWGHGPISAFSFQDQVLFDKVLYNNLDIISSNKKMDKLKHYEFEYNLSSKDFYDKWKSGEMASTPQTHDWAILCKNIPL